MCSWSLQCPNGPSGTAVSSGSCQRGPCCCSRCGGKRVDCVKYRTKKILFFSAEDYLTLPSGSPSTFIILLITFTSCTCSSYLLFRKISSKFHSISISSWLWTRITLIISRSFSVSNFWIPKKSFSFIYQKVHFVQEAFYYSPHLLSSFYFLQLHTYLSSSLLIRITIYTTIFVIIIEFHLFRGQLSALFLSILRYWSSL